MHALHNPSLLCAQKAPVSSHPAADIAGDTKAGKAAPAPALAELKVWENYSVVDLLAMFLASENVRRIPPRLMVGQITHKIGKKIFPIGKLEGKKMNLKALSLRQDGALT